jgi:hypothetical protein
LSRLPAPRFRPLRGGSGSKSLYRLNLSDRRLISR